MKSNYLIIFFCLFISINLVGQEYKERILFEPLTLQDVRAHERKLNSKVLGFTKIQVSDDFFIGAVENQDYFPLVFRWTSDDFDPPCKVECFYFGNDSIAKVIIYDWNAMDDITNLKTGKARILAQQNRMDEYKAKYNAIYNILTEKFGKPTSEQKIRKKGEGYAGSSAWEIDGKTIELFFTFTTELKTLGEFVFGTFRVRLKIDNNSK